MTEKLWTTEHLVEISFPGPIELARDPDLKIFEKHSRKNTFFLAPSALQVFANAATIILNSNQDEVVPTLRFLALRKDQVEVLHNTLPTLEEAIDSSNEIPLANIAASIGLINTILDGIFVLNPNAVAFSAYA